MYTHVKFLTKVPRNKNDNAMFKFALGLMNVRPDTLFTGSKVQLNDVIQHDIFKPTILRNNQTDFISAHQERASL